VKEDIDKAEPASAYQERARLQALEWAGGNPRHNMVDDECCPDFSCCVPEMFTEDGTERWQYYCKKYGSTE